MTTELVLRRRGSVYADNASLRLVCADFVRSMLGGDPPGRLKVTLSREPFAGSTECVYWDRHHRMVIAGGMARVDGLYEDAYHRLKDLGLADCGSFHLKMEAADWWLPLLGRVLLRFHISMCIAWLAVVWFKLLGRGAAFMLDPDVADARQLVRIVSTAAAFVVVGWLLFALAHRASRRSRRTRR